MSVQAILEALACGQAGCKCWAAVRKGSGGTHCPEHDDRNPSLSLSERDGKLLVNCHAGCPQDAVVAALRERGLWPAQRGEHHSTFRGEPIIATYPYTDLRGTPLFQVGRTASKQFPVWRAGAGPGEWGLGDARLVLFRLPAVLAAASKGERIFVVEGEKDAQAVEAAGGTATCNPGGAGKWRPEYSEALRGAEAVIVADKDKAGYRHAAMVAQALQGIAAPVAVVEAREGKDAADHLAAGHSLEDFVQVKAEDQNLTSNAPSLRGRGEVLGLPRVSAAALQEEARRPGRPGLQFLPFLGHDGFVVRQFSHLLSGYPKTGKTELLARLAWSWASSGDSVLFLTEEPRLVWEERLAHFLLGGENMTLVFALGGTLESLSATIETGQEAVVIVDTLRLLGLTDENDNAEINRVLTPLIALCRQGGKTLLLAHHTRKGGGDFGVAAAGGHALVGVVDVVLELHRDGQAANRRTVKGWGRIIQVPELVYELKDGDLLALGDPLELALEEVMGRVREILTEDFQKTRDVREALGEPRPSDTQVSRALAEMAQNGEVLRDPPISEGAEPGKTYRWAANLTSHHKKEAVGGEVVAMATNDRQSVTEDVMEIP